MKFAFTRENLSPKDQTLQRIFEILPGLTSWTLLLGMSFLSIFHPVTAAVLIIAFYLFWLLRLIYMTILKPLIWRVHCFQVP